MTKEFGQLCRRYRYELWISQGELAKRTGYYQTYISRVETGSQEPSKRLLDKLLEELQVPPERQAEFLLYGAGHLPERIKELLKQAKTGNQHP